MQGAAALLFLERKSGVQKATDAHVGLATCEAFFSRTTGHGSAQTKLLARFTLPLPT
jgi:hypothetical protein